jgi:hypothetical protein
MARISVNAAGDLGMVPINYVAIDVGEKLNSLDGKVLELEEEVDDQFEFDRHTENRFSQGEERIAALEERIAALEAAALEERIAALEADKYWLEGLEIHGPSVAGTDTECRPVPWRLKVQEDGSLATQIMSGGQWLTKFLFE